MPGFKSSSRHTTQTSSTSKRLWKEWLSMGSRAQCWSAGQKLRPCVSSRRSASTTNSGLVGTPCFAPTMPNCLRSWRGMQALQHFVWWLACKWKEYLNPHPLHPVAPGSEELFPEELSTINLEDLQSQTTGMLSCFFPPRTSPDNGVCLQLCSY